MSIFWLILAALLWGVIHSLTAGLGFKTWLVRALGPDFARAYRIVYNLFSVLTFLPLLWLLMILPGRVLYVISPPWTIVSGLLQLFAAILLLIGVFQTDPLDFIGLRSLIRPVQSTPRLVTTGLYRWVRHPLYFAGLLYIWLTPVMSDTLLTFYATLTVYIIVGAIFEERKLLREFGQEYVEYRARTPFLIPRLRGNKSRRESS